MPRSAASWGCATTKKSSFSPAATPSPTSRRCASSTSPLRCSTSAPQAIAETCDRLFTDSALRVELSVHASAFARTHFDLKKNTEALAEFYSAALKRPSVADWSLTADPTTSEATVFAAQVASSTDL